MNIDPEFQEKKTLFSLVNIKGKVVLEVGCGDGRFSKNLFNEVLSLVAIDCEASKINKANKIYAEKFQNILFIVLKGEEMLSFFKNHYFDLIIFSYSLHEHENIDLTLQNSLSLLSENGEIIVIEPIQNGDLCRLIEPVFSEKEVISYTRKILTELSVKNKSYKIVEINYHFENKKDFYDNFLSKMINKTTDKQKVDKVIKSLPNKRFIIKDRVIFWKINK